MYQSKSKAILYEVEFCAVSVTKTAKHFVFSLVSNVAPHIVRLCLRALHDPNILGITFLFKRQDIFALTILISTPAWSAACT